MLVTVQRLPQREAVLKHLSRCVEKDYLETPAFQPAAVESDDRLADRSAIQKMWRNVADAVVVNVDAMVSVVIDA